MTKKTRNHNSKLQEAPIMVLFPLDEVSPTRRVEKSSTIPTEPAFVHIGILLPLVNLWPARQQQYAVAVCLSFSALSILCYWFILICLRRTGTLERFWRDQVLDVKKSRVSAGAVISLLEHLHIVMVFIGLLLFAANGLWLFQPHKNWLQSLYMALMAFNIKGFDDFQVPETVTARAICASLSLLSVTFVGFLAAVFLKPFVIVFKHK